MNEWISVKDRLPEFEHDAGYVLVACKGGCVDKSFFTLSRDYLALCKTSGCYSRKRQGKESGYFEIAHRYGYEITHWMPLPPPPAQEQSK